jgi:hypothetical protein
VDVNQSWGDDEPRTIADIDICGCINVRPDGFDDSILDEDIADGIYVVRRIDDVTAPQENGFHVFRPFLLSFNSIRAKQEIKRGHADCYPRCNLLTDDTLMAIGEVSTDFKTAIHRTRVHYDGIWFRETQSHFINAKGHVVFAGRWKECFAHPFQLESKDHYDIGAGEPTLKCVVNCNRQLADVTRHQGVRPYQVNIRAKRGQTPNIGSRNPGVCDITHNCDLQAIQWAFDFLDGVRIEESLCWMLMHAIPRVNHRHIHPCRSLFWCARERRSHDDAVSSE